MTPPASRSGGYNTGRTFQALLRAPTDGLARALHINGKDRGGRPGFITSHARAGGLVLGTVASFIAYGKMPRATFMVRHPVKTVKMVRMRRNLRRALTSRRVALGMGAAAMAIPVGLWIGRKLG